MKKLMEIWIYVLPFPLLVFFYIYWNNIIGRNFAVFAILSGTIYGYVFPGIAVNIMKKWKFHGRFMLGGYYAHHGFKYSSNMNLCFFIASLGHIAIKDLSITNYISIILATGCIQAFWIWIHDTFAIKNGNLEIQNVLAKEGDSPEQITFKYVPACFFSLGSVFAIINCIAIQSDAFIHFSLIAIIALSLISAITMGFITSIVFGIIEMRYSDPSSK